MAHCGQFRLLRRQPRLRRISRPDHRHRRPRADRNAGGQLLAPWRARIIAYDPYVPPAHFLTHGVTPVDYRTLLQESDVVSFHVVLTPETRYMFGEAELKLMKPNAIVLNTARGKVVDEKALA